MMRTGLRCFRLPLGVLLLVIGGASIFLAGQEPQPPDNSGTSKYVGADVCQGCHEDQYKSFMESPHAQTLKRTKVSEQGCEACHGPGAEHVEAGDPEKIRHFASATPATILHVCGSCHELHISDAHTKAHLTCLTCHSVHHYVVRTPILVAPSTDLCKKCHH